MKKIASGLSYTVYEYSADQVLKKPNSYLRSLWVQAFWLDSLKKLSYFSRANNQRRLREISCLFVAGLPQDKQALFANPVFMEDQVTYLQDKVQTLSDYFADNTFSDNVRIIDNYIKLFKKLLQLGVVDSSFKLTVNSGINVAGEVVAIDYNDFSFDRYEIRQYIQQDEWLRQWSYRRDMQEPRLKKYFYQSMKKEKKAFLELLS